MIAIKDFKMPVDCQSCFARFGSWCRLDLDERMVVPALPEESVNGFKPDWCPLVDVPDINVRTAIDALKEHRALYCDNTPETFSKLSYVEKSRVDELDTAIATLVNLPSAQPERLTDDDFETIRIHLSAYKERLCNQRRWKEAEEYQRIINRFMSFASAQPEQIPEHSVWFRIGETLVSESKGDITAEQAVEKIRDYLKRMEKPERKKGKWLLSDEQRREDTDNGNYLYFCSNCLRSDVHAKTQEVPYCWWCGADMRGE